MINLKYLSLSLCTLLLLSGCKEMSQVSMVAVKHIPQHQGEVNLSYASVVKKVAPAVVNIFATQQVKVDVLSTPFMEDPFFKHLFENYHHGDGYSKEQKSLGSGVIINPDGLILTNYHVIEKATEIRVVLSDKREYIAQIVNIDKSTDLALLQIQAKGKFASLEVTPQEDLEVGDIVLAIGNPFGVGQSVTSGIVSALARSQEGISDYRSFIQTDAAINPGNSGGALVTTDGRLVGINTAIYSKGGGSLGIGFAIPTPLARPLIESLQNGGHIARPWLGIEAVPVSDKDIQTLALPHPFGVVVQSVYPKSPADKVGLIPGDFIAAIDGHEIQDVASLDYQVGILNVGKKCELTIVREGVERNISILLEEPMMAIDPSPLTIEGSNPLKGVVIKTLSPALALDIGGINPMKQGVIITEVSQSSGAHELGIKSGDIIESINNIHVKTKNDAIASLQTKEHDWILLLRRENKLLTLEVSG